MSTSLRRWSVLVAVLGLPGPLRAAPDAFLDQVRIKPLASRTIVVQTWDPNLPSPEGGSTIDGSGEEWRLFAFSPDGKLLVSADASGWQLEMWDVATGKSLGKFGRTNHYRKRPTFFPDSKTFLLTGGAGRVGFGVELWDAAKQRRVRSLDEDVNQTWFPAAAVSLDGKAVALGRLEWREGQVIPVLHFWDAATGDEIRVTRGTPLPVVGQINWQDDRFGGLCFSPDGKALAAVVEQHVVLLETATGKERCLLGGLSPSRRKRNEFDFNPFKTTPAFSSDGRTLAVGCEDGALRLWDVPSGREYAPLVGPAGPVRCLLFTRDGKALLSFGSDDKVLTWPVEKLKLDWLPKRDKLDAQELASLWDALSGDDVLGRYVAIRILALVPEAALPLRERLKKVPPVEAAKVRQLLNDLGQEDFNDRKKAVVELRKYGELAIPQPNEGEPKEPGNEFNRVAERLLKRIALAHPTDEQMRAFRALDALARMDTPASRQFLQELSEGVPGALLTRHAKVARARTMRP